MKRSNPTDLFGREIFEPIGTKQSEMFEELQLEEPDRTQPAAGETEVDRKIRRKFKNVRSGNLFGNVQR